MARLITLTDLVTGTRRLADLENATQRFPDTEVYRYVNQALVHVYRQVINVADRPFYQKDYSFLITGSNTTPTATTQATYPLPPDFLQILSVMWASNSSGPWDALEPYEESERHMLINSGFYGAMWPSAYGIVGGTGAVTQGTIATAYSIEILPQPPNGSVVQLRYIPSPPSLQQPNDTFDGILGFEDAVETWAAILMRRKDDLDTVDLERDFERHMSAIRLQAKRRDRSRPPRTSIVRGRWSGRGPRGMRYWSRG